MKIHFDENTGKVLGISTRDDAVGLEFTGALPEDFLQNAGQGKYTVSLNDGSLQINETQGWVKPSPPDMLKK